MKMVSNTQGSHFSELKNLFKQQAQRVIIASPFLAQDMLAFLDDFNFENIEAIELITTFKPRDREQLTKPFLLNDFFEHFQEKYPRISIKLHIDNRLHGKIYISIHDEKHIAILGSANFTRNGLKENHEWGVWIEDSELIGNIVEDLYDGIDYPEVTHNQIKKSCLFAKTESKRHPEWREPEAVTLDILAQIYSVEKNSSGEPQYFLKPIGTKDTPILREDQKEFSELVQPLYFSKKKPKNVGKGDVLITFGVGSMALLSYFRVTGGLEEVTPEEIAKEEWKERWPWYMEGRNQAEVFSQEWWEHNLRYDDILNEFATNFPGEPVTTAGGTTLGTLNFGADKVQITPKFGEFLISKINTASKPK